MHHYSFRSCEKQEVFDTLRAKANRIKILLYGMMLFRNYLAEVTTSRVEFLVFSSVLHVWYFEMFSVPQQSGHCQMDIEVVQAKIRTRRIKRTGKNPLVLDSKKWTAWWSFSRHPCWPSCSHLAAASNVPREQRLLHRHFLVVLSNRHPPRLQQTVRVVLSNRHHQTKRMPSVYRAWRRS